MNYKNTKFVAYNLNSGFNEFKELTHEYQNEKGSHDFERIEFLDDFEKNKIYEDAREQFTKFLSEKQSDVTQTLQSLNSIVMKYPQFVSDFIGSSLLEKIWSISENIEFCEMSLVLFANMLDAFPCMINHSGFLEILGIFFNIITPLFTGLRDVMLTKKSIEIMSKILINVEIRNKFYESKCMKEIRKCFDDVLTYDGNGGENTELIFYCIIILKLVLKFPPFPDGFHDFIGPLIVIAAVYDDKLSINALQVLTFVNSHGLPIINQVKSYNAPETTFIEDLTSFLQFSNPEEKRIEAFRLLSDLSRYGDFVFVDMNRCKTLFEAKFALRDANNNVITESLKFFYSWCVNAKKYRSNLFDQICDFNFIDIIQNVSHNVKFLMMDLIFFLAGNASPTQIVHLINLDFLSMVVEQLDEENQALCSLILQTLFSIADRCQMFPDFVLNIRESLLTVDYQGTTFQAQYEELMALLERFNFVVDL